MAKGTVDFIIYDVNRYLLYIRIYFLFLFVVSIQLFRVRESALTPTRHSYVGTPVLVRRLLEEVPKNVKTKRKKKKKNRKRSSYVGSRFQVPGSRFQVPGIYVYYTNTYQSKFVGRGSLARVGEKRGISNPR